MVPLNIQVARHTSLHKIYITDEGVWHGISLEFVSILSFSLYCPQEACVDTLTTVFALISTLA